MEQETDTDSGPPLRLRWSTSGRDGERPHLWLAYDGPWIVAQINYQPKVLSSDPTPFKWQSTMVMSESVVASGRSASARLGASRAEASYFDALSTDHKICGGLHETLAYAAWRGLPLPADLAWAKAREIDRLNPFPIRPHRGLLSLWAVEDRARGGRGMLTPALLTGAFGANWKERMQG